MTRRYIAFCALILTGMTGAHAEDCSAAVQAAFEKQRTLPSYRLMAKQQSETGVVETQRDYVAPDRMYNKITIPGEPAPLETIAVGRWAWANQGGGWQELQPQFAQSVTFEVSNALATPVEVKDAFACLGKVMREGKEYLGYRNAAQPASGKPEGHAITRTVLVDAATGLPAHNLVGEADAGTPPVIATTYSYPADLAVEAPLDALPAGKPQ